MMRKINEIFYSLQGEGYHTGTPAIFVRFSGCNLKCDFCDTQHEEGKMMTDDEIIAEVPEGEMSSFSTSMRQITQGRGSFTTEFARYERVPEHIAQKVINESKDE